MSSEKGKIADSEKDDWLDTTVIDFLDKEIAASTSSGTNRDSDDLDATLTNLLQEVLSASDRDSPPDTKAEEVDQMLSGILMDAQDLPPLETTATDPPASTAAEDSVPPPIHSESAEPNPPVPIFLPIQDMSTSYQEPAMPPPLVFTTHDKVRPMMPQILIGAALVLLLGGIGLMFRIGGTKVAATPSNSASSSRPSSPLSAAQPLPVSANVAPGEDQAASTTPSGEHPRSTEPPDVSKRSNPAQVTTTQAVAAAAQKVSDQGEIPSRIAQSVELSLPAKSGGTDIESLSLSPGPGPAPAKIFTERPANPSSELPPPAVTDAPAAADAAVAKFLESPAKPESATADSAPAVPVRVVPPELISRVLPVYPEAVRRMRLSGTVVLDLQIDANGKVVKAVPVTGMTVLSVAAVNAALQWRYKPASANGKNIPSQSRVSVIFK
jgi:TonB family protein